MGTNALDDHEVSPLGSWDDEYDGGKWDSGEVLVRAPRAPGFEAERLRRLLHPEKGRTALVRPGKGADVGETRIPSELSKGGEEGGRPAVRGFVLADDRWPGPAADGTDPSPPEAGTRFRRIGWPAHPSLPRPGLPGSPGAAAVA